MVDATSRRDTTSNQRWNKVVYFNVEIYNVEQRRINVVYFNVDMKNVRQCPKKVALFNVRFHNVGKCRNRIHRIQSFNYYFIIFFTFLAMLREYVEEYLQGCKNSLKITKDTAFLELDLNCFTL